MFKFLQKMHCRVSGYFPGTSQFNKCEYLLLGPPGDGPGIREQNELWGGRRQTRWIWIDKCSDSNFYSKEMFDMQKASMLQVNKCLYVLFSAVPPTSLPLQGGATQRKKLSAPRISLSLDQSEDDLGETPDDLDIDVDDLDTPDEGDYLDYTDHEMDWEGGWQYWIMMIQEEQDVTAGKGQVRIIKWQFRRHTGTFDRTEPSLTVLVTPVPFQLWQAKAVRCEKRPITQ